MLIKKDSSKADQLLCKYNNYEGVTLDDVYTSYSHNKKQAYKECMKHCENVNGSDFHIISHNTNMFSIAYENNDFYFIETKAHIYKIEK